MLAAASLAAALALAQASDSARAAAAAEKAAQAAQAAAEAAARAAAAAEKAAQGSGARPSEAAPAAPGASPWSGAAGAGFISLTGNSRAALFVASGAVERKSEGWILGGRASGSSGRFRPAGGTALETSALAAAVAARLDRRFTPSTSAYALGIAETDHVKSVEARYGLEVGTGIAWVDSVAGDRRVLLRTDLGVRVQQESRFQYYPAPASLPSALLVAPRFGAAFQYRPGKDVMLAQDIEVLPDVKGESRVLANAVTRVASRIMDGIQLGVSFSLAHDSAPAPGRVPTDTVLATTVEVLF